MSFSPQAPAQEFNADLVKVYEIPNSDDSYDIYADNDFIAPVFLKLDFTALENLVPDQVVPLEKVLPAGGKKIHLLNLKPGEGSYIRFSLQTSTTIGDPGIKPDADYPYLFPYEHGKKYQLTQGFNGAFTHKGENAYAVDFDLPEGSLVCAARGGLVVEIKQDSNVGGLNPEFGKEGNFIRIYHDDGSFGTYAHLKQNGSLVKVGDRVQAGDSIGYSGNTGLTSGPHLHFDVRSPDEAGQLISFPISFLNYDGTLASPKEGDFYYALHPGKERFKVVLGKLLTNEDFGAYLASSSSKGDVEIRSERLDNTFVLFISNGDRKPVMTSVKLSLENLYSSRGTSISLEIPAQSEVFLTLLNIQDISKKIQYSADIKY